MGYFSNGDEGLYYEDKFCSRCIHGDTENGTAGDCAVWMAHMIHNYDECNNKKSILHLLIPLEPDSKGRLIYNGECAMFKEANKSADNASAG